jgi:hypothetical protein
VTPKLQFDAVIQAGPGGGAYVILPSEAAEVFGTRAMFAVAATFDGVGYRGSTRPIGDGTFGLGITKAIRSRINTTPGALIHVTVQQDTETRTVEIPDGLSGALETAGLTNAFDALAYTPRKEFAQRVASAKDRRRSCGGSKRAFR